MCPRDLFNRYGLRCTAQRTALFEALRGTTTHPTAEELYQSVKPCTSSLSLATVYSTLETFCNVGLVRKIPTADGGCRYDACTHDHVHVRFGDDGHIEDVPDDLSRQVLESIPPSVIEQIEARLGIRVGAISVHLDGETQRTTRPDSDGL